MFGASPRQIVRTIPVLIAICLTALPAHAKYSGGTGEPNDPYQIGTAGDLMALGETPADYDKHFILTADIDLDPNLPGRKVFDRAVIAPDADPDKYDFQGTPFAGVFDGNAHAISHMTIRGRDYLGLFGRLGWSLAAEVKDLGIVDVNVAGSGSYVGALAGCTGNRCIVTQCYSAGGVKGAANVGGLVGRNAGGTDIARCHCAGEVDGNDRVGGLIGSTYHGTVTRCYSIGVVNGTVRVGGLVGDNYGGDVMGCHSSGAVSGSEYVGGLVGYSEPDYSPMGIYRSRALIGESYATGNVGGGTRVGGLVGSNLDYVVRCFSSGTVRGEDYVGGLVGSNEECWHGDFYELAHVAECYSDASVEGGSRVGGLVGENSLGGVVTECCSTGTVRGEQFLGGLVGSGYEPGVTACFWDIETSGLSKSAGGTGMTKAEMQRAETFLDAGWDFVDETANGTDETWWIVEGKDHPRLTWELLEGLRRLPLPITAPRPSNGATDVLAPRILSWHVWASGMMQDVYFGEAAVEVGGATTDSPSVYRGRLAPQVTTYDPGVLELGRTYYWRVDQVNEADPDSSWKGKVWSFMTADFIVVMVVDDFESYTDDSEGGTAIFQTWIDGFGFDKPEPNHPGNGTGSMVGNWPAPIAEQTIVHDGKQSMPIAYDDTYKPWYSEAERTWETPQDWTIEGADTLTLYFRGEPNNSPEPLYVGIEDSAGRMAVVVHPDAKAVLATEWRKWHIALADVQAAGADVTAVKKMVIGVGDRPDPSTPLGAGPQPGGTGRIYIDDIRLTKRMP